MSFQLYICLKMQKYNRNFAGKNVTNEFVFGTGYKILNFVIKYAEFNFKIFLIRPHNSNIIFFLSRVISGNTLESKNCKKYIFRLLLSFEN